MKPNTDNRIIDARGIPIVDGSRVLLKWGNETLVCTVTKADPARVVPVGERPINKLFLNCDFQFALDPNAVFTNIYVLKDEEAEEQENVLGDDEENPLDSVQ